MKKLFLFLVVLCTCVSINAQVSLDDYIGTWRGRGEERKVIPPSL